MSTSASSLITTTGINFSIYIFLSYVNYIKQKFSTNTLYHIITRKSSLFYRILLLILSIFLKILLTGKTKIPATRFPTACTISNTDPDAIHAIIHLKSSPKSRACAGAYNTPNDSPCIQQRNG